MACVKVELSNQNRKAGAPLFAMNKITQDMRFKQAVIEYSLKHGVTKAAIRYKTSRQNIYRWRKKYDGTLQSLADRSHRPHSHPNQHTEAERKLIRDMRRRNPALGLSELRRAEAARPPKGLSCVPASAFCVSFRSQSKGLEQMTLPGVCVFKRMQGISAFPHRRSRAQALSVCGRWMRLPACGIAPLRERRACVCLCIAAAFFALGFCAAYEEQRLCAADFLRTMRRRSERGLSAAYASRRRHGVHRPFFRRRAELDRPPV